jgi:serine/threonine protein kinase
MGDENKKFLRYCIVDGSEFSTDDADEYYCPLCRQNVGSKPDTVRDPAPFEPSLQPLTAWMPDVVLLDQFKVIRLVGESGVSRVYQVEDLHTGKMLAVKCPRLEWDSAAGLEQARREAEILFQLHGAPRVLQIEQARLWEGIPLVFTELAELGDISRAIQDRSLYAGGKQAALKRVLDIAIQAAKGMVWVHLARILHGDLKPGNILLMANGEVRIAGFGLAQALPEGQHGVPCRGYTPAFASPEQHRNSEITVKSDLWNWGVSVLEMFIGEITWFRGIAALEALDAYLEEGVEDPDLPVMPAILAALLRRCFQENPADRPESMDWVARKLEQIYEHVFGERYRFGWLDPLLEPVKLNHRLNRGIWYFELGDFERAAQQFKLAARSYPYCAWARFNLGLTCLNQTPEDLQAALQFFEPLPSYQDPGYSVGQVSKHFMSLHDIRIDLDRRRLWIDGDIGIALFGGPRYAPYDFNGINLGPEQLPEFGESQHWFRYGNTDRSPWQISAEKITLPELGAGI